MEKAIDRLYQYLDCKGIKPTNFERELGLSNGYLSSQKKRNADIGESIIIKITDYCLDLSLSWFLTGRGSMLNADSDFQMQQQEPAIIYIDNPDKSDLIALQREKIRSLEAELKELKRGSIGGFAASEDYNPAAEIISKRTHNKS